MFCHDLLPWGLWQHCIQMVGQSPLPLHTTAHARNIHPTPIRCGRLSAYAQWMQSHSHHLERVGEMHHILCAICATHGTQHAHQIASGSIRCQRCNPMKKHIICTCVSNHPYHLLDDSPNSSHHTYSAIDFSTLLLCSQLRKGKASALPSPCSDPSLPPMHQPQPSLLFPQALCFYGPKTQWLALCLQTGDIVVQPSLHSVISQTAVHWVLQWGLTPTSKQRHSPHTWGGWSIVSLSSSHQTHALLGHPLLSGAPCRGVMNTW